MFSGALFVKTVGRIWRLPLRSFGYLPRVKKRCRENPTLGLGDRAAFLSGVRRHSVVVFGWKGYVVMGKETGNALTLKSGPLTVVGMPENSSCSAWSNGITVSMIMGIRRSTHS